MISLSAPIVLDGRGLRWIPVIEGLKKYWKKKSSKRSFPAGVEYDRYPLAAVLELMELLDRTENGLGRVHVPALIMHARGDRRVSEKNADTIFDAVGSLDNERVFFDERYCKALTFVLARIYVVLELIYLPSRVVEGETRDYAETVVDRTMDLLEKYGWEI